MIFILQHFFYTKECISILLYLISASYATNSNELCLIKSVLCFRVCWSMMRTFTLWREVCWVSRVLGKDTSFLPGAASCSEPVPELLMAGACWLPVPPSVAPCTFSSCAYTHGVHLPEGNYFINRVWRVRGVQPTLRQREPRVQLPYGSVEC